MEKYKNLFVPASILGAGVIIAVAVFATGGLNIPAQQGLSAQTGGDQQIEKLALGPKLYQEFALQLGADMDQFNDCVAERKYKDKVENNFQEGVRLRVTGTPGSFVNGQFVPGAVPYEQLKSIIDSELSEASMLPEGLRIAADEYIRGNPNAQVTLVEFSDLQCPFCKRFHPTVQQVLAEYGDQVRWIYRHYPIDQLHPHARPAAEASECLAEQKGAEGFWQFIDAVFTAQG